MDETSLIVFMALMVIAAVSFILKERKLRGVTLPKMMIKHGEVEEKSLQQSKINAEKEILISIVYAWKGVLLTRVRRPKIDIANENNETTLARIMAV